MPPATVYCWWVGVTTKKKSNKKSNLHLVALPYTKHQVTQMGLEIWARQAELNICLAPYISDWGKIQGVKIFPAPKSHGLYSMH